MKNMKYTGIVRRIDELGRIVLPVEIRRVLDLEPKDSVEIYLEGDMIGVRKYHPSCIFCGATEEITDYKGKRVCAKCIEQLNAAKNN